MTYIEATDSFTQSFTTTISGVTFSNPDGTKRQDILAKCRLGEDLTLIREHENGFDPNAVAVHRADGGMIGYIPKGDVRLVSHLDRGGTCSARILKLTGGPSLLDRIFGWPGHTRGCVVEITKNDFDWKKVDPWMKLSRVIDEIVKKARSKEKENIETSITLYLEAIEKIHALDSMSEESRYWRTCRYPIDRLSLCLDRAGRKSDSLEQILRWMEYKDHHPISKSAKESVKKREARLRKVLSKNH